MWSYRKSRDRKWRHRKRPWPDPEVIACAIGTFDTTTIVVVSLCKTDRATGSHVTLKGIPLCVRTRNWKLCYIRPSGAFWPEVTLWNVTRSDRRYVIMNGLPWSAIVESFHRKWRHPHRASPGRWGCSLRHFVFVCNVFWVEFQR
jgi:hypothetical protein